MGTITKILPLLLLIPLLIPGCGTEEKPARLADREASRDGDVDEKKIERPEAGRSEIITITSPAPGDTLRGGKFELKGKGVAPDSLLHYRVMYDSKVGIVWGNLRMTPKDSTTPVGFSRRVDFSCDWGGPGTVEVFDRDPESGEERGIAVIPVIFSEPPESDSVRTIYAYYPNRQLGSHADCALVFPLARELPGSSNSLARGAVYYLLGGVTEEEEEEGYFNDLPRGLRVHSITLEDGLATLDFSHHLMQLDRSCGIDRVRAQIEQTLAQFHTVDAVVIRVNGRVWTAGRR